MKLLVDIGNTRVKWAALVDGELMHDGDFAHGGDPAAAATAVLARTGDSPEAALVANVAGKGFADMLAGRISERWNIDAQFAVTQPVAGHIHNAYRDYTKLGVDRWLAILAAAHHYPGASCIVDAGTAVTIDLVAPGGAHLGGYIVPGLDLMWRALTDDTGDLGHFTAGDSATQATTLEPGLSTREAIGHGSLAAICAVIDRCTHGLAEDNRGCVVVVTGGDAERIIPHLAGNPEHRPRLVLEGLVLWDPGQIAIG